MIRILRLLFASSSISANKHFAGSSSVIKGLQIILAAAVLLISGSGGVRKAIVPADPKGFSERRPKDAPGIITQQMPFQYVWLDEQYARRKQEEAYALGYGSRNRQGVNLNLAIRRN